MINGKAHEFVDHIYHGDELWFFYAGKKFFLEGWSENEILELCLYKMCDNGKEYTWKGTKTNYPVKAFLNAQIWNGKTFWEAEQDITWVDD